MSGYHVVRPVVKLADGTLLVGDKADGSTVDWLQTDIPLAEVKWRKLDPERAVTTGDWVNNVDLSKVDEVGVATLSPGGGHGIAGSANLSNVELFARPIPR